MAEWDGATLRTTYKDSYQAKRDEFADRARDGGWAEVLAAVEEAPSLVNAWRPGGPSWYTPLHQAAWHGASESVVRALLSHGAWRTLRTAAGDRPLDIALRGGRTHLTGPLLPVIHRPVPTDVLRALQSHLHGVIRGRAADLVDEQRLRLPELDVLTELETPEMWFPVPGMYGGFRYALEEHELKVDSWSRVVGGSGETHRITVDGAVLTDSGFV
ncbi:hypothetical protein [Actinophytocola sp. NPDC049390]|uniref:hypothetical protein n=1 Tax=Actinophytocola sp. NPDC049390 TaxID=3363894 RepID=UPI003796EEF5